MIPINLHPDKCREYAYWRDYMLIATDSAVITLPPTFGTWFSKWDSKKRNLYRQSINKGFNSQLITWDERTAYLADVHAINTSKLIRQGKPLGKSYQDAPVPITGRRICAHHYSLFIGCLSSDGRLVAYISANFCGDLVAASQIMGHGNFLKHGIMVNLWHEFMRICSERGVRAVVYSRWNDGFDGLKFWKKSVGMKPMILTEMK